MKNEIARLRNEFRLNFQMFAYRCLKIRTKTDGIQPLVLNSIQLDFVDRFHDAMMMNHKARFIILKARQMGLSTLIEAIIYWHTIFHSGTKSLVLTHLDSATKELFEMTKRYHDNCPEHFKPLSKIDSANELSFDGIDSSIKTATSGSKNVGHGSTIQCLHWSEVSRSRNQSEMTAGVMQTVPDGDGTMIFLESTANGIGDYFHQTWQAATRSENEYTPIFYKWSDMQEYRVSAEGVEFSKEEREYQELYNIDDEQLAWRQAKINSFDGSPEKQLSLFREQYPITADEAFQSSTSSYISADDVHRARKAVYDGVGAIVAGVDPARDGRDSTGIVIRQGRKVIKAFRIKVKDTMSVVGHCARLIEEYKLDAMFIDTIGIGAGVYDRLAELGYKDRIFEAKASESAENSDRYFNRRAEMWGRLREWLESDVDIADSDYLESDLLLLGSEYDSRGRTKLQSKKGLSRSPDIGDALAMTFYILNVRPHQEQSAEYQGIKRKPTYGGSMLSGSV